MKLSDYSFGSITVEGAEFTSDLLVLPDRVINPWWRREGHSLSREDLGEILKEPSGAIKALVVGTGAVGAMRVPGDIVKLLEGRGIEVHTARTARAVEIYNELRLKKKTAAALHLTC